jgi:hypothetical protein
VFNGGGVTYKEAKKAVEEGHNLIVINGSGRKADELAKNIPKIQIRMYLFRKLTNRKHLGKPYYGLGWSKS